MGQTVNLLSFDFGGSNPSCPTGISLLVDSFRFLVLLGNKELETRNRNAEVAQLVERQPSKL